MNIMEIPIGNEWTSGWLIYVSGNKALSSKTKGSSGIQLIEVATKKKGDNAKLTDLLLLLRPSTLVTIIKDYKEVLCELTPC